MLLKSTLESISSLRNDYFRSLPEFQELYVELAVAESDCYVFRENDEVKGYVICNREGVLLEFFVINTYLPASNQIFKQAIMELTMVRANLSSAELLLSQDDSIRELFETELWLCY